MFEFIKMVYQGKTLRRITFNRRLARACKDFTGTVLDLGAGSGAMLRSGLPKGVQVVSTDIEVREGVDRVDLNKPLPYADDSFEVVTLFHVLYILEDSAKSLREIQRVLKPNGKLYIASMLISAEIPHPHDYHRLTYEGLLRELKMAGFSSIDIERVGGRASSATIILDPFFVFNTVRLLVYPLALLIDRATRRRDTRHPAPHSYFTVAEK